MTPIPANEYDAFVAWAMEQTGWRGDIGVQPTWPPNIGGVIQNDPLYMEWLSAGMPSAGEITTLPEGVAEAVAEFEETGVWPGVPGIEEPDVGEEEPITQIWAVPGYDTGGLGSGAIFWSDGRYTEAVVGLSGGYNEISEQTALQYKGWWDEKFQEDPQFFGGEVISEGGWDYWVTYNEDGSEKTKSPIGETKDKGTSDYEADLLDVQQQLVDIQQGRLELDIRSFEEMSASEAAAIGLRLEELEILRLPYEQLTFAQQAQFDFDERVFEEEKRQWDLAFANLQQEQAFGRQQQEQAFQRDIFEFENLSAWQQSQQELGLRGLGLQERQVQAQFQQRPMDWLSAWQFSNPTWAGQPRGTPNPQAQPFLEIPEGGFSPPPLPQGVV